MRAASRILVSIGLAVAAAACNLTDPDAWYVASDEDKALLGRLQREAELANRKVRVPVAASAADVAISAQGSLDHVAEMLVGNSGLARAYRGSGPSGSEPFHAFRLIDRALCNELDANPSMRQAGVAIDEIRRPPPAGTPCVLRTEEAPDQHAILVSRTSERVEHDTARITRHRTTLDFPDGRSVRLVHYGFRGALVPEQTAADIARTLGGPWPRGSNLLTRDTAEALIAGRLGQSSRSHEAMLTAFLDGGRSLSGSDIEMLAARPGLLHDHADTIVDVLAAERRPADDGSRLKAAADLVAGLSEPDFERLGPRIRTTLAGVDPLTFPSDLLIERAGSYGVAALPLFDTFLTQHRAAERTPSRALYAGICRIGAPAASALGDELLSLWESANALVFRVRPRERSQQLRRTLNLRHAPYLNAADAMLYVALKRIGLGDVADARAQHAHKDQFRARSAGLGTASPADRCTATTVTG